MNHDEADELAYSTYLRAFARIVSGATGGIGPSDLGAAGDSRVTLALVLGVVDAKTTPPTVAKRAELLLRLKDHTKA